MAEKRVKKRLRIGENEQAIIDYLQDRDFVKTSEILSLMAEYGKSSQQIYMTLKRMRDKNLVKYDIKSKTYFLEKGDSTITPEDILKSLKDEKEKAENPEKLSLGERIILSKIGNKKNKRLIKKLENTNNDIKKTFDFVINAQLLNKADRIGIAMNLFFLSEFNIEIPLLLDALNLSDIDFKTGIENTLKYLQENKTTQIPDNIDREKEEKREREKMQNDYSELFTIIRNLDNLNNIVVENERDFIQ